jgi:hypothetical protein
MESKALALAGVQNISFGMESKALALAGVQSFNFGWSPKHQLWLESKTSALAGVQNVSFGSMESKALALAFRHCQNQWLYLE